MLLILKNGIRDSFKLHLLGVKLNSQWSPLGVKFNFSDEHARPFYIIIIIIIIIITPAETVMKVEIIIIIITVYMGVPPGVISVCLFLR